MKLTTLCWLMAAAATVSTSLEASLVELASSGQWERLLVGIELFASFFIPFYFFKAGLHLEPEAFGWRAILLGLAFTAVTVPLRVGLVVGFRRLVLAEAPRDGLRVGLSLVPTLVFTLVLADILKEQHAISPHLFGALVVFALVNTVLPGLLLRAAPPEFAEPEAPRDSSPPPGEQPGQAPAPEGP